MEEEGYLDEVLTSLKLTDIHWYSLIFTDIYWYWVIFSLRLIDMFIDIGDFLSIIRDQSLLLSVAETWSPPPWWEIMERSGEQDYDCFSRWRSGGQRLFEGVVGRCQEELYPFQMSPFHILVYLCIRFLNIVCYQLYQSDVTHLTSLPPRNKW